MKPCKLKVIRDTDVTYPEGRVGNPVTAARYLRANLFPEEDCCRENAWLLTVDAKMNVTGVLHLSMGGTTSTDIDKRLIVKAALDTYSKGILLAHNHPSGNPLPSKADIENTNQIRTALKAFGLNLIDHIILGEDSFYSFSDERTLPLS